MSGRGREVRREGGREGGRERREGGREGGRERREGGREGITLTSSPFPNRWTGSNTNPNNNDGQGRAGTDRSNIVLLTESVFAEGSESSGERYGHWGRSYPAHLTKGNQTFLGLDRSDREALAILNTRMSLTHDKDQK